MRTIEITVNSINFNTTLCIPESNLPITFKAYKLKTICGIGNTDTDKEKNTLTNLKRYEKSVQKHKKHHHYILLLTNNMVASSSCYYYTRGQRVSGTVSQSHRS